MAGDAAGGAVAGEAAGWAIAGEAAGGRRSLVVSVGLPVWDLITDNSRLTTETVID